MVLTNSESNILFIRRHLVTERNREELDEVSNRRLTSMALDVSRGLSYLAELKYVHRDVACRNCLVNSSRVVKLADFGMTRPMYENDYYRFSRKGMSYENIRPHHQKYIVLWKQDVYCDSQELIYFNRNVASSMDGT